MRNKLVFAACSLLLLGSSVVLADQIALKEVVVKAGKENSISLSKLNPKFSYTVRCNILNLGNDPLLGFKVEQRYNQAGAVTLDGSKIADQGILKNDISYVEIDDVNNNSGSFTNDYLYFHNSAESGSGFDYKVTACTAIANNPN